MKLMNLIVTLFALSTLSACASKNTAPAKTETPATMAAEKPAPEAKKEDMHAKKSSAKKAAAASEKSAMGTAEVNCKSAADERKLSIQVKDAGCELHYTKAGEAKVIASQISGSEKCEEVMTTVKEKLVAANFTCQ